MDRAVILGDSIKIDGYAPTLENVAAGVYTDLDRRQCHLSHCKIQ
jgi:hypothetical protein